MEFYVSLHKTTPKQNQYFMFEIMWIKTECKIECKLRKAISIDLSLVTF